MRMIDGDALTKKLVEFCNKNCPYTAKARNVMCGSCFMGLALESVDYAPTIEPERKKGKWMVVDADIAESSDICECDQCGGRIWKYKNAKDTWHFCPRCGADMRGEQNE